MRKGKFLKGNILSFLLIAVSFSVVNAQEQNKPVGVKGYIQLGDELDKEFKYEEALEEYLKADQLNPDNYEVLWRISRTLTMMGKNAPKKERQGMKRQ